MHRTERLRQQQGKRKRASQQRTRLSCSTTGVETSTSFPSFGNRELVKRGSVFLAQEAEKPFEAGDERLFLTLWELGSVAGRSDL